MIALLILLALILSPVFGQEPVRRASDSVGRVTKYRVVDGDTFHGTASIGWGVAVNVKVRVKDFNAPERNEPGGKEATARLELALQNAHEIVISTDGTKSFDRYVCDVFVDGCPLVDSLKSEVFGAQSVLEPIAVSTVWQEETQARIDAAAEIARKQNKTIAVEIDEGVYEFVRLNIPSHVSLVAKPDLLRSVRLVYVGNGNETAIRVGSGYGQEIKGFEIRSKRNVENLEAIRFDGSLNAKLADCRIDLRGKDNIGIMLAGRESIVIERVESRASVACWYRWGDNIVFRDVDFGVATTLDAKALMNEALPSTPVYMTGNPNQVTFEGSVSFQGGDHAILAETSAAATGQNLTIRNLRYEQSISRGDPNLAAIQLNFTNRGIENLLIDGCRWTDRVAGIKTHRVITTTVIGSRLPGTRIQTQ